MKGGGYLHSAQLICAASADRSVPIHHDQHDVYSLRGAEVEGLHLWREPTVSDGFLVSEAFPAEFDARKLKCLERVHVREV